MKQTKFKTQILLGGLLMMLLILSCKNTENKNQEKVVNQKSLTHNQKWSERMLISEMHRFPESWMLDFHKTPKWSYPNGLVLMAAKRVYNQTRKQQYYNYIYSYPDTMVNVNGDILTYTLEKQNLDMLKSGDVLLYLYDKTKEDRFLKAIKLLRSQINTQPRTSDGGFWHKKRYTNQMWLDGLFMAEPFYAQYTYKFDKGEDAAKAYDDIVHQFDLIQKHTKDPQTGLLYHGWDESKEQAWANKQTGTSPNFWSRAMGWYGMAIVDVLDYLPKEHPGHARMVKYLNEFAAALLKVQDSETGLWYQVLDQGNREGNYLEATGSSMFAYAFAKGANKGYLPNKYKEIAEVSFNGIIKNLVTVDERGIVNLNQCCAVAGLGGNPYRDGSYEYYVNEEIRANDPKGTGAFILASLELDK
ncbi:glycoside hydrolase family 88/105 protein [Wenyingzhuangia sp. IMCC45467]